MIKPILKTSVLFVLLIFLSIQGSISQETENENQIQQVMNTQAISKSLKMSPDYGKIPLYFIHNEGQVNEKALFHAKTSRYTLWLTKEGLVFDSTKKVKKENTESIILNPRDVNNPEGFTYERDVSSSIPTTIYVDAANVSGIEDGSQVYPFNTIQEGIDAASNGDTVFVADGIYKGDGNRDIDFLGKAITVTSINGAEVTIIDCEGTSGYEHRGFYFHNGETLSSIVNGFTIKNGYGPSEPFSGGIVSVGGGIYCTNSSPMITNNIIIGNTADYGGGIQCWEYSSPTIDNNVITQNSGSGAGIYCYKYCSATITNNIIVENVAGWGGGGIKIDMFSSAKIINNLITENSCQNKGGGIYCGNSSPEIINNTITRNSSQNEGGGAYFWYASPIILNTIIWGNIANNGNEISHEGSQIAITYSDVQGGWPGEGNIDADPLFVNPNNYDYHLSEYSPCIGAGIMTLDVPDTDIEGNPRPNPPFSCPDIGAYEDPLGGGDFYLVIIAEKGGITNPSPGTYICCEGTEVAITAIPDTHYRFSHWSGDISGTENTQGKYTNDPGTKVVKKGISETHFRFTGVRKKVSSPDNPITIIMDSDKSIKANFIRQYTLTIASGAGGTIDPLPGAYVYDEGTKVTITAIPNSNYRFSGWSGDMSSTDNPLTITMDSDKSISANFIRQYLLTLASGTGGTVDPLPGAYVYDEGTGVTITAIPDTHNRFSHWSGDISSSDNPITIIMDSDKSIKANFVHQYMLTTESGSGGTTNPSPGSYIYDKGTKVTITAIPDAHYQFSGWSGDRSGLANPITITMNSDKSIIASFVRIIYSPLNFTGQKVLNRSLSQAEYINVFSWQPNPNNINIMKYRIYQIEGASQSLLIELNANTFQYWHRRVEKDKLYTYAICAVNNEDREGDPTQITVQ